MAWEVCISNIKQAKISLTVGQKLGFARIMTNKGKIRL